MAEIQLTRPTGFRTDQGREYKAFIDRKQVGGIKVGETKVLPLSPGRHELQLKVDWGSSEKLRFDLGDGDRAQFVCAPRIKQNDDSMRVGFRMIYWSTLGCRRYIDLRQGENLTLVDEPNQWLQKFNGPKLFAIALLIGIAYWAVAGNSVVVMGVVVAAMAFVVGGLVGRGIGKVAVQANQEGRRRRED